jgi:hypothetical protein
MQASQQPPLAEPARDFDIMIRLKADKHSVEIDFVSSHNEPDWHVLDSTDESGSETLYLAN